MIGNIAVGYLLYHLSHHAMLGTIRMHTLGVLRSELKIHKWQKANMIKLHQLQK